MLKNGTLILIKHVLFLSPLLHLKSSYSELPASFLNFEMMNCRSSSLRNFASSGKSAMQKCKPKESRQVAAPSSMKTTCKL